jgi:hypothetical protein
VIGHSDLECSVTAWFSVVVPDADPDTVELDPLEGYLIVSALEDQYHLEAPEGLFPFLRERVDIVDFIERRTGH